MVTGKPTGRRSLGRPRRRCVDDIRIYIRGISVNTRIWIDSARGRDYLRALVL